MPVAVIVAIIGVIGTIIVAAINLVPQFLPGGSSEITIIAHVTDLNGNTSVANAKVALLPPGTSYVAYTDSNGLTAFTIDLPKKGNAQLFVQADQYSIYDQQGIQLDGDQNFDIRLIPKDSNDHHLIVRVVDNSNGMPAIGANVVFLVNGNTLSQSTDSNGIARFTIIFSGDTIDADITVSTPDYRIERQRVTLRPEEVQDIRLDRSANALQVTDFQPSGSISPVSSDPKPIAFGQTLIGAIVTPGQLDVYTFSANANNVIRIRAVRTAGSLCPVVNLYGTDGNDLAEGGCGRVDLNATLPASGNYKIVVSDASGPNTGEYGLSLQKTK